MEEFLKEEYLQVQQSRRPWNPFVLLKNENECFASKQKTKSGHVIGPLAEVPYQQLGTWIYEGEAEGFSTHCCRHLRATLAQRAAISTMLPGLPYSRSEDTAGFKKAIRAAKKSDVIVFFGGEEAVLTGEGHSRGDMSLPGAQQELIDELQSSISPLYWWFSPEDPILLKVF